MDTAMTLLPGTAGVPVVQVGPWLSLVPVAVDSLEHFLCP